MRVIYVKELSCFQNAPEDVIYRARITGKSRFVIPDGLASTLQDQLERFIRHRGDVLSLDSLRQERWCHNRICSFLLDRHSTMVDICEFDLPRLEISLKKWMIQNGISLAGIHNRKDTKISEIKRSPLLFSLERLYRFSEVNPSEQEIDKNIWDISNLPFSVRANPVTSVKTISFMSIVQDQLREETKKAALFSLKRLSLETVRDQVRAMGRLSEFLSWHFSDITSVMDLNRDVMEEYLIYLNTADTGMVSPRSAIIPLKSLLRALSIIMENPALRDLLLDDDTSSRGLIKGFRSYSDRELKVLNDAYSYLPRQIARALVLQHLLGNRISETLTLTKDCLVLKDGSWQVRVYQGKTRREVYKPANETVRKLIEASFRETKRLYGERKYLFVNAKDPDKPMTYKTIQYQMQKLILEQNLRDDSGALFKVGTHTFRHTLGRRLTERHVDDKTIAQLLGHAGLSSVHRYRMFGSPALADETRDVRREKDVILLNLINGGNLDEL